MFKVVDSAVPVACWSCSIGHNDSTLFCPHCSKIQPPPGGDYFSVFSLEPKLNLDLSALEHEFHRLSRKLHPDRFARALENEKQWSLADTALLNDAYRTLKDPIRRTEYLLKLLGAEIGEGHASKEEISCARPGRSAGRGLRTEHAARRDARGARDRRSRSNSTGQPGTGQEEIRRYAGDGGRGFARSVASLGFGKRCRAASVAKKTGGLARPPALPQQSGPRRERSFRSMKEKWRKDA